MRAVVIPAFGLDSLKIEDRPAPVPGAGQVLVGVKAVSLNYRDLLVAKGQYNPKMPLPRVPCSDCAGEVLAVGEGVSSVKAGDRVCGTFFQGWESGDLTDAASKSALGGAIDGVLAEQVVLSDHGVIPFPAGFSFEEAATLPCAGVTAWNAITNWPGFTLAGKTVLVQGTGGVSMFALQFAKALGATVLATSGNDDKLAKALALGADAGVNYKQTPDWAAWAKSQTNGVGVDLVVEVGGAGTLEQSVKAVRAGGRIALIGVLAGGSTFNPLPMMMKGVTLRGIYVGSRATFADLNKHLAAHPTKPVIDRVFAFDQPAEAFKHLEAASHFGKVVIRVG
jgi:NADPH:quinone reductase-like Zn-dependent oxidoreductase